MSTVIFLGTACNEALQTISTVLDGRGCRVKQVSEPSALGAEFERASRATAILDLDFFGDYEATLEFARVSHVKASLVFLADRSVDSLEQAVRFSQEGVGEVLLRPLSGPDLARLSAGVGHELPPPAARATDRRGADGAGQLASGFSMNELAAVVEAPARVSSDGGAEGSLGPLPSTTVSDTPHLPPSHDAPSGEPLGDGAGSGIGPQGVGPRPCHETATEEAIELEKIKACCRELEGLLIGKSPAMQAIRRTIAEVADTNATVMIYGESGTGKELVARAIHQFSDRRGKPFVPVNMAAVPGGLAESLLFGHEKGAFTSASATQVGSCEAASGGTLFLDEIGEMELSLQPKLLRFLQEGVVQRVGSQELREVNPRIVTATNRDPASMVRQGKLREDLYFRLHVVPIEMPPLRERAEDIVPLAEIFLRHAAETHGRRARSFSEDTEQLLRAYHWPGNVRQLQNIVERMTIFARGAVVEVNKAPPELHSAVSLRGGVSEESEEHADATAGYGVSMASLTPMQRQELLLIMDALEQTGGHVVNASRLLQIGQATLYRKINQYKIPHTRRRVSRPK